MAFGDWDTFAIANYVVTTETASAILGDQSIAIDNTASGNGGGHATPSVASGLTRGITAGRMRTLMRLDAGTQSSATHAGIYFLSSVTNPLVSGTCYSVSAHGNGDISVNKHGVSLPVISSTLSTSVNLISNISNVFGLEVMWFNDSVFGGTRIEVKTGTATDFSDLTLESSLTFTDTVSPLSGTGGEGIFQANNGGNDQRWVYDNTQLFTVSF